MAHCIPSSRSSPIVASPGCLSLIRDTAKEDIHQDIKPAILPIADPRPSESNPSFRCEQSKNPRLRFPQSLAKEGQII